MNDFINTSQQLCEGSSEGSFRVNRQEARTSAPPCTGLPSSSNKSFKPPTSPLPGLCTRCSLLLVLFPSSPPSFKNHISAAFSGSPLENCNIPLSHHILIIYHTSLLYVFPQRLSVYNPRHNWLIWVCYLSPLTRMCARVFVYICSQSSTRHLEIQLAHGPYSVNINCLVLYMRQQAQRG